MSHFKTAVAIPESIPTKSSVCEHPLLATLLEKLYRLCKVHTVSVCLRNCWRWLKKYKRTQHITEDFSQIFLWGMWRRAPTLLSTCLEKVFAPLWTKCQGNAASRPLTWEEPFESKFLPLLFMGFNVDLESQALTTSAFHLHPWLAA